MNFDHLFIIDVEGERRIDADKLPLRVGTGSECEIRLPGPGGGPVALLDLLDGAPFVQPVGRDASMQINGEPLRASSRLAHDDELQFFGSRIRISTSDDRLALEVRLEESAYITQPPELVDAQAVGEDETIAPTAFRRAAETLAAVEQSQRSPLKILVSVGLGALLLMSYLLFSAKSIQFEVDPPDPDQLSIVGGWFRLPLADRVLLRRGEYTVNIQKQGYYDVSQSFVVGDEPGRTIEIKMRRLPGRLIVSTEPIVDAVVSIDNGLVGKVPYGPIELQPGEHSISVQADRYLPFADVVDIPGLGRLEQMHVQLVPRWSNVEVRSEPPGASIFVGDERIGETPAIIELLEGTHQVSVIRDGFKAWDGTVIAKPNSDQTLPLILLEPANARLLVKSIPRGANVTVNGRYRGQSPITLSLSPGIDYKIGLSKAGYGGTSRSVRLQAAASDSITVDLTARTGTLTVNVQPADATVFVDGRARGSGSTTLRLSSAPHRIEVRKTGYASWSRTITPRPGYPQTVSASLRSHASIERAKIDITQKTASGQLLRRIEPGTFMMGASRAEQGRRANEVLRPVTLSRPYLIGVREVTNREFAEFRENHDSGSDIHVAMGGDDNPVARVTWGDAAEYCNWLSAREGLTPAYVEKFGAWDVVRPLTNGYRLPTEAEWAWAIRYSASGKAAKFSWGTEMPPKKNSGNYADRAATGIVPTTLPRYDDGFSSTAPTGKFPPNSIGIYDGSGNVAEWVNDYYTVPTPGITQAAVDPLGPASGKYHVIRGSSWRHAGATELRLSYRDYGDEARADVGFRIARTAD
ncbi:MAG: SUMF1/EgtB/PvdO family nonheme iron enzyme [Proteobacteria bacterium]|nr:SUMF1/EgtB/PvdO family nonheme iron enzyme [Pseudomonadota bacterium]